MVIRFLIDSNILGNFSSPKSEEFVISNETTKEIEEKNMSYLEEKLLKFWNMIITVISVSSVVKKFIDWLEH